MSDKVRLDKWLWAARFFKTRSIAISAIDAGHINLNGERAKPARALKSGDMLRIHAPHGDFEVEVLLLSEQRRSAEVAQTLYAETPESIAKRARDQFAKSLQPQFDHPQIKGRPTKKWRRQLTAFEQPDA
ncbi:RNA-binding S4 domain-containing protein [Chitinibacter bivalviorum]|uniref:RNA-binding S4 domain-containing protein n=1 Tax=Chitinibacter bivalviorum TaxID=2739434 RepID=A0A7H9BHX5_9NEIS|nr:RNA-binding S4 domain-containing protein [Chitinibacter bivalviorum]QLG87551.1 RNA-binding S4 domain-containing protein [Chitinibacter bivalviorum]